MLWEDVSDVMVYNNTHPSLLLKQQKPTTLIICTYAPSPGNELEMATITDEDFKVVIGTTCESKLLRLVCLQSQFQLLAGMVQEIARQECRESIESIRDPHEGHNRLSPLRMLPLPDLHLKWTIRMFRT
jgi:hypothetical protein